MKQVLLFVIVIIAFSCKKQALDAGGCYECKNLDQSNPGRYVDIGCKNSAEWKQYSFTDYNGNDGDKYQNCRLRR